MHDLGEPGRGLNYGFPAGPPGVNPYPSPGLEIIAGNQYLVVRSDDGRQIELMGFKTIDGTVVLVSPSPAADASSVIDFVTHLS